MTDRAVVIGLGCAHRQDDAVGLLVARRVAATHPELRVLELDDPTALLDAWAGADTAVVVDAVQAGGEPGDIVVVDLGATPVPAGRWAGGGTHALGLAAAVDLARALGALPRTLVLVGVDAAGLSAGTPMTAAVAAAVTDAASRAAALAADSPAVHAGRAAG